MAAYKALTDEFWTGEGPSYLDQWGRAMKLSLLRIDSLAAEVATAESTAERLATEAREEVSDLFLACRARVLFPAQNFPMSSSPKRENQPRRNLLARFLEKARNGQPETSYDTACFLSAGKQY